MLKGTELRHRIVLPGVIKSTLTALLCLPVMSSYGSGFQLSEQSVTGLGRAFAGSGVAANDASVLFYNAAGMELVRGQHFQGAINGVLLDVDFSDDGNSTSLGVGGEGDTNTAVPNVYYVSNPVNDLKWGVGLTAPFGLKTNYDRDWIGRYHAIDSELATLNIGPSVSYRVNDQLSVGAGVDIQYADALLSRANPPVVSPLAEDTFIEVEGDSWGYGYNLGVLYRPIPEVRLGLSYRSKVEHTIDGDADVTNSNVGLNGSYDAETDVALPETAYLSGAFTLNNQWEVFATARWTRWNRFDVLDVEIQGLPDEVMQEQWENTWMYSIGANYQPNSDITLRAGLATDRSPVPNASLRTPRIPDSDRDWLTLGVSFHHLPQTTVDLGLAYLQADDAPIDNTVVLDSPLRPTDRLSGNFDSDVTIVGAQVQYQF